VRRDVLEPLDANLGAREVDARFSPTGPWQGHRFEMDNGDVALFARGDDETYWIGNTETPRALWRTEKYGWTEVPYAVARWAQRELLADLHESVPWLEPYPHVSWFFLPVLLSKDGRETTREFFGEHAAGFPNADRETALEFYESFLRTAVLDPYREEMAGKLGTSEYVDLSRMRAAMSEFTAGKLLVEAGYDIVPEIDVDSGHTLDYRASRPGQSQVLVEVTRPRPPARRSANTPAAAVSETADSKAKGQLRDHQETVLLVDCSSFPDDEWHALAGQRARTPHQPAVVYRARPDGTIRGYRVGDVPLDLDDVLE
jgi:hypothetical protein